MSGLRSNYENKIIWRKIGHHLLVRAVFFLTENHEDDSWVECGIDNS